MIHKSMAEEVCEGTKVVKTMKTKDDVSVWIVGSEFSAERVRTEASILRRCRHHGWHRLLTQNGKIWWWWRNFRQISRVGDSLYPRHLEAGSPVKRIVDHWLADKS